MCHILHLGSRPLAHLIAIAGASQAAMPEKQAKGTHPKAAAATKGAAKTRGPAVATKDPPPPTTLADTGEKASFTEHNIAGYV